VTSLSKPVLAISLPDKYLSTLKLLMYNISVCMCKCQNLRGNSVVYNPWFECMKV
jgi:hypothetical protein